MKPSLSPTLLITMLITLPGATLAQAPAPAEQPGSPPAEKPMAHDMAKMHGMMHPMRPPMCLYEGKRYSQGALLSARGVKPLMVCAPVADAGGHADHGSGNAPAGHGPMQPPPLG